MSRRILILCLLGTAPCVLGSCGAKTTTHVGPHCVDITDAGVQGQQSRFATMPDDKQLFTYESVKTKVGIEDEVLTVNGKKYVIPQKNDSITIVDGRVKINGQPAVSAERNSVGIPSGDKLRFRDPPR